MRNSKKLWKKKTEENRWSTLLRNGLRNAKGSSSRVSRVLTVRKHLKTRGMRKDIEELNTLRAEITHTAKYVDSLTRIALSMTDMLQSVSRYIWKSQIKNTIIKKELSLHSNNWYMR